MAKTREEIKEQNRTRQQNRRKALRTDGQSKLEDYHRRDRERKVTERKRMKTEGLTKA